MIDNDLRERVKEYYHTHRISFARLAEQSFKIFNAYVTVDQLKHWSTEDGGWKKPAIDDQDKLKIIAEKVFEAIEETENLSVRDLTTLANTYLTFATKMPPEIYGDNRPPLQQIIDAVSRHAKLDTDGT